MAPCPLVGAVLVQSRPGAGCLNRAWGLIQWSDCHYNTCFPSTTNWMWTMALYGSFGPRKWLSQHKFWSWCLHMRTFDSSCPLFQCLCGYLSILFCAVKSLTLQTLGNITGTVPVCVCVCWLYWPWPSFKVTQILIMKIINVWLFQKLFNFKQCLSNLLRR